MGKAFDHGRGLSHLVQKKAQVPVIVEALNRCLQVTDP